MADLGAVITAPPAERDKATAAIDALVSLEAETPAAVSPTRRNVPRAGGNVSRNGARVSAKARVVPHSSQKRHDVSHRDAILAFLKSHPGGQDLATIGDGTGRSKEQVAPTLSAMRAKGEVTNSGGFWEAKP